MLATADTTTVLKARSQLGVASRNGDPDRINTARRDLAAEKLAAYVARVVAEAPKLTQEQSDRITALLRPAGGNNE